MTFKQFIDKAKRAPKKNLAMGILCIVGIIALIIYSILVLTGAIM